MTGQLTTEGMIHVLVADEQVLVRRGVCALLAAEPGIDVIGETGAPEVAMVLVEQQRPDVVLLDLAMFPDDGIRAIQQIVARYPASRVLVLTNAISDDRMLAAIKAGAKGFLLKSCEPQDLVRAIREVRGGGAWLHPAIAHRLLGEISHADHKLPAQDALTEREMDVLRLVAHGHNNQQIADELSICEGTARVHVSNILGKLHLASRTQAALYAVRTGLVTLEETA